MHRFPENIGRVTVVTAIDPRLKLLSVMVLLAMVLTYRGFLFPLFVAVLCLGLCASMRISVRSLLVRYSEPALIVIVLVLIKSFFAGKEIIWKFHCLGIDLVLYRDGLIDGLLIGARVFAGVSLVTAFVFATSFTQLLGALSWLRVPRGLIEVSMFAYRCIFLLLDDAAVIYNAQKNRLGYSSVRRALSSFGVLAGSLTLKAFDNSQHAATAMIQRGYDGTLPLAAQRPLKIRHVAISIFFLLLMGVAWSL